jgi:hypothetical protein
MHFDQCSPWQCMDEAGQANTAAALPEQYYLTSDEQEV